MGFMGSGDQLVGLDFGADVIRAVQTRRRGHTREMQRYHEIKLPAGTIKNDIIRDERVVINALKQLWLDAKFDTRRVILGIGNQQVLVREITVPVMKLQHINESLPYRVAELLPMPAEQAVMQFYPTMQVTVAGEACYTGLMIATTKATTLGYANLLRASKLDLNDIDYTSFAVLRGRGTAHTGIELLIDLRAEGTNMIITDAGVPRFIRHVITGGGYLLDGQTGAGDPGATRVEQESGAGSAGTITRPPVRTLHTENLTGLMRDISATIQFYQHNHPGSKVDNLVLLCDDELLPGVSSAMIAAFNLPVHHGTPASEIRVGPPVDAAEFRATGSKFVTALGLTVRK